MLPCHSAFPGTLNARKSLNCCVVGEKQDECVAGGGGSSLTLAPRVPDPTVTFFQNAKEHEVRVSWGGPCGWGKGHFLLEGTERRSSTIRVVAHPGRLPQMMVSGHPGVEGGRSDIHPSTMEINALFDKRKQTIYVHPEELPATEPFLWVKCRICILMGCYQVINAPVRIYYLRSELKGSLQNRFHLEIGISSELAFDMLFLALPARGSHSGRPVR